MQRSASAAAPPTLDRGVEGGRDRRHTAQVGAGDSPPFYRPLSSHSSGASAARPVPSGRAHLEIARGREEKGDGLNPPAAQLTCFSGYWLEKIESIYVSWVIVTVMPWSRGHRMRMTSSEPVLRRPSPASRVLLRKGWHYLVRRTLHLRRETRKPGQVPGDDASSRRTRTIPWVASVLIFPLKKLKSYVDESQLPTMPKDHNNDGDDDVPEIHPPLPNYFHQANILLPPCPVLPNGEQIRSLNRDIA